MKIAIYSTSLPQPNSKIPGVDSAVHRLANELAKNIQDEITVISLTDCPSDASYRHTKLFANVQWLKRNKIFRLFVLPFLLNFVNFKCFDIIHFHGDDWFYICRTVPTIRTLHGSALNEARSATSLKRKLVQYIVYPLEHISARLATIPLAIGKDTAEIYDIKHIIDNGINLKLFFPGSKSKEPTILFVGTWNGRKRGKFLFETFVNCILPKVPNAKLYMVSDTCSPHPNVVDVRFPDDLALAELYRQAWVFAYPSTYEGFGITYLEALASGTAIVSSPNVGAINVLAEGKYGEIVDDDSFANNVIELLKNSEKRSMLETLGHERVKEFSWDVVASKHREIYKQATFL